MKNFRLFLLLVLFINSVHSQTNSKNFYTVKGTVLDNETKNPLEFASVSFVELINKDPFTIGTVTDAKGNFKISVPNGIYDIKVEFLSFEPVTLKNISIHEDVTIKNIHLKITLENLDEVTVNSGNKAISLKLDKMVYFLDKDLTISGGSVLNALSNLPNISVNADGLVSLRNDPNVKILVNGKQSALGTSDLLNNFQADAIEKVEVITVPSAKFGAQGTAGIINIILKKGKNSGLNTTVNLTAGNPDYYGFSTNVNYKKDKINLYNTSGYLYRDSPGNAYIHNKLKENGTTTGYFNDDRTFSREKSGFNTLFGLDYELNPSSFLNTSAIVKVINGTDRTSNYATFLSNSNTLLQSFEKFDRSKTNEDLFEIAANYTKLLKKEVGYLYFHYAYEKIVNKTRSAFTNFDSYPITGPNIDKDLLINDHKSDNYQLFGVDFAYPFGKKSVLEGGYEGYVTDLTTDYIYKSYNSNTQQFENDINQSNLFDYYQLVHSWYSKFESNLGKLSVSAGIRAELADTDIKLVTTGIQNKTKKTDWFPSAHIGYELSEVQNLTLSYGKRISRPVYWILNPFETKISETNIVVGNPIMEPYFSHLYELKHLSKNNKLTFSSSIYIKDYSNAPERVTYASGKKINGIPVEITTYKNIASLHQIGYEFFTTFDLVKWMQISGGFNIYNSEQQGTFDYLDVNGIKQFIDFSSDEMSGSANVSSKITFPKDWRFQFNYKYYAPSKGAISERKEYQFADLAMNKNFLNNKISLTVSATDIFNSNKIKRTVNTSSGITNNLIQWNERMILMNLTYRFNQVDKKSTPEIDKDKMIMF